MTTNDEIAFDETDLVSLRQKLASLDLTEPERAALGALMSDDDVTGFGRFDLLGGIRMGLRKGPAPVGARFNVRASGLQAMQTVGEDAQLAIKPGRF